MRLTTVSVAALALSDGEKDRIWFDDDVPGFGLRLRDSGSRTWIYQYKIHRKTRRIVLGKASAIKLARAREIASEYHARVRQGGDPVTEKRVQIERTSHTFGPLAEQYLERRKSALRPRSWAATALYLQKHAAPLHALPVDSSSRRTTSSLTFEPSSWGASSSALAALSMARRASSRNASTGEAAAQASRAAERALLV